MEHKLIRSVISPSERYAWRLKSSRGRFYPEVPEVAECRRPHRGSKTAVVTPPSFRATPTRPRQEVVGDDQHMTASLLGSCLATFSTRKRRSRASDRRKKVEEQAAGDGGRAFGAGGMGVGGGIERRASQTACPYLWSPEGGRSGGSGR
ncbi:uncharacterized protein A4U43_C04F2670 [Asparagus officinalis]|uniref:Uncharacterized protein n=1 Tax=Asparagus officinalis TaxID=4686 RepID=A0A5P1F277_ASPOF|nr:uncharacterized protein A4U43_C04F2670 [Asparagus officinalis]